MNLSETEITILPKHGDQRGNLSVAEQLKEVPFEIKRCFWMYDVPEGKGRGGHAHKTLKQFVIAMSGSFKITLVIQQAISICQDFTHAAMLPT